MLEVVVAWGMVEGLSLTAGLVRGQRRRVRGHGPAAAARAMHCT